MVVAHSFPFLPLLCHYALLLEAKEGVSLKENDADDDISSCL